MRYNAIIKTYLLNKIYHDLHWYFILEVIISSIIDISIKEI